MIFHPLYSKEYIRVLLRVLHWRVDSEWQHLSSGGNVAIRYQLSRVQHPQQDPAALLGVQPVQNHVEGIAQEEAGLNLAEAFLPVEV